LERGFIFIANQMDVGAGNQSPAEMETVKKILETVNANVTRQLLEASVQRVKNSAAAATGYVSPAPASLERCTSSTDHQPIVKEGLTAKLMLGASPSPRVSPALEDMIEEVPDTDDHHAGVNGHAGDAEIDAVEADVDPEDIEIDAKADAPVDVDVEEAEAEVDASADADVEADADADADADAASEAGTDDSGLVMALDQDSPDHRDEPPPSVSNVNAAMKSSERTRSTISEDKAAVSSINLSRNSLNMLMKCSYFFISDYWFDSFHQSSVIDWVIRNLENVYS